MDKILVAPNAYKGSLSAIDAANAICRGLERSGIDAEWIPLPIADGGDGSLPVILNYLGGDTFSMGVRGPLGGRVEAKWGFVTSNKIAIIELAEASGIRLMQREDLQPLKATTYGTGQLIREAVEAGAGEIYLTLGGSATVDAGIGILEVLGAKFQVKDQWVRHVCPGDFLKVSRLDISALIFNTPLKILCDVSNPLLGAEGAAKIFGPQKGADQVTVDYLEQALHHMAGLIRECRGKDITRVSGGGAAGGVAAGLWGVLDAELINGGEQILTWAKFDEQLGSADRVITGEGKIDAQTNFGKGPGLVAKRASEQGIPVIGLSGALDDDISNIRYFDELIRISDPDDPLEVSMAKTEDNLERAAYEMGLKLKNEDKE